MTLCPTCEIDHCTCDPRIFEPTDLQRERDTLAQQVEKVRALHQPWDDGPQPYCTHDREPWPCPTELALGAR